MIGMDQAAKTVHMDAGISIPVEASCAEAFVPFRTEKMSLRHQYACILCHQAIGVFDSSRVPRVLRRRKLDHPVREARLRLLPPSQGGSRILVELQNVARLSFN